MANCNHKYDHLVERSLFCFMITLLITWLVILPHITSLVTDFRDSVFKSKKSYPSSSSWNSSVFFQQFTAALSFYLESLTSASLMRAFFITAKRFVYRNVFEAVSDQRTVCQSCIVGSSTFLLASCIPVCFGYVEIIDFLYSVVFIVDLQNWMTKKKKNEKIAFFFAWPSSGGRLHVYMCLLQRMHPKYLIFVSNAGVLLSGAVQSKHWNQIQLWSRLGGDGDWHLI